MTLSRPEPRTEVGAYVLGALEEVEAAEFEDHLEGCAACTRELASLNELMPLLAEFASTDPDLDELLEDTPDRTGTARVGRAPGNAQPSSASDTMTTVGLELDIDVDEAVADAVSGAAPVVRTRRGVLHRRLFGLAASLAVFATGIALGGLFSHVGDTDLGAQQAQTQDQHQHPQWAAQLLMTGEVRGAHDAATGVSAKVGMERKKWGTHVALELRGVHGPLECSLVAVDTSGRRETVTNWLVPKPGYGVPSHPDSLMVHGGAGMLRPDIDHFEVATREGRRLVSIPV
ncbi:anti-sigma factor family protein [Streptomyces sp. NPDC005125]